jgi:hypothetical protein
MHLDFLRARAGFGYVAIYGFRLAELETLERKPAC